MILVRSCVGLVFASAGPLLPFLIQEYNISLGEAGWFASIAPAVAAFCSVPLGIIGSRYSLKKTFVVGAFLQASGIFAPFCNSYPWILLTRVGFAMGTTLTIPVASAILAEWFTSRELPFINSLTVSFVSFGNTLAFVTTVPLATLLSWKAPITIFGAFAFTCAVAWLIFGKDTIKKISVKQLIKEPTGGKSEMNIKQALKQRATIIMTLALLGSWCCVTAIGSWLPTYYHRVFDIPLATASSITSISTITGIIGSVSGGILSMRIGRRKPLLIISGAFMGISAITGIMFNNIIFIIVSVALFGFFANLQNAAIYTMPMELPNISRRTGAVVFSLVLTGGNIGNCLGPLIVGYTADFTGLYWPGFIICAILSLCVFLAGVLLPETGPSRKKIMEPATSN